MTKKIKERKRGVPWINKYQLGKAVGGGDKSKMTDGAGLQKCKIIRKNFNSTFDRGLGGPLAQTGIPFPVLENEILKAFIIALEQIIRQLKLLKVERISELRKHACQILTPHAKTWLLKHYPCFKKFLVLCCWRSLLSVIGNQKYWRQKKSVALEKNNKFVRNSYIEGKEARLGNGKKDLWIKDSYISQE